MSNIKEIRVYDDEYECADGCCYEHWWESEIELINGRIIFETFQSNDPRYPVRARYSSARDAKLWTCIYAKNILNEHLKFSDKRFK